MYLCIFTFFSFNAEMIYYDEVVISASHIETEKDSVPPSISIITREDILKSNIRDISKLLNMIAGITIVRSGAPGQTSHMYIRGARPSHTAVMMNGVLINDPSSVDNSFDFNNISMGEIQRIEIIKSAHGSINGSSAMGGIINIIPREFEDKNALDLSAEASIKSTRGSHQNIFASYRNKFFNISLNFGNEFQREVYASDPDLELNDCPDPFNRTYASLHNTIKYNNITNSIFLRYSYARSNIDSFGGDYGNDPNYLARNRYYSLINNLKMDTDNISLRYSLGIIRTKREYNNEPDEFSADLVESNYNGYNFRNYLSLKVYDSFIMGMEYNQNRMSYDYFSDGDWGPYHDILETQVQRYNSYFIEYNYSGDNYGIVSGLRYDDYEQNDKMTYRITPFYRFRNTSFYANLSTGFKVPSLYELYSPYGNPELENETAISYELSVLQKFPEMNLEFSVSYFHNKYENLIDFDSYLWQYYNVGKSKSEGIEFSLDYTHNQNFQLKFMSEILSAKNTITGEFLLRRPRYKHGLIVNSILPYDFNLWTEISLISRRDDIVYDENYEPARTSLDSYYNINLSLSRNFTDKLQAYLRIDNLLDENYHYIKGYARSTRIIYLGMKYNL